MTSTIVLNSYNFYIAPVCDPYYNSVRFLYHFDGNLLDSGPRGLDAVALGGDFLDPLGAKFGIEGLYGDQNGQDLGAETPSAVSIPVNTEYTFELWAKWNGDLTGTFRVLSGTASYNTVNHAAMRFRPNDGTPEFVFYDGGSLRTVGGELGVLSDFEWHHLAVVRRVEDGNWITRFYTDGRNTGTAYNEGATAQEIGGGGQAWKFLSGTEQVSHNAFRGSIDEVRLTQAARYTAEDGFTPPIAAYPDSSVDDEYFDNVKLLMHMDGADDGTTFTDSSSNAEALTANGSVTSTDQVKFGTAAYYGDSLTDSTTVDGNDIITDNQASFTMEAWVYILGPGFAGTSITPGQGGNAICSQSANGSNGGCSFGVSWEGKLSFNRGGRLFNPGQPFVNNVNVPSAAGVISNNQWHHVAFSFDGPTRTVYLFADGELVAQQGNIPDGGWPNTVENTNMLPFTIGASYVPTYPTWRSSFNGYIDDVRVTQDVARYTSSFTPPSAPFEDEICPDAIPLGPVLPEITTLSTQSALINSGDITSFPNEIVWTPDGSKCVIPRDTNDIYWYTATTPFDFNTLTSEVAITPGISGTARITDVFFKPDGTKVYLPDYTFGNTYAFDLDAPFNFPEIAGAAPNQTFSPGRSTHLGMWITYDGTIMYVCDELAGGGSNLGITNYTLSTPWDITTATELSRIATNPGGLTIGRVDALIVDRDGTRAWLARPDGSSPVDLLRQIDMSVAHDLTTATITGTYQVNDPAIVWQTGISWVHTRPTDAWIAYTSTPRTLRKVSW